MESSPSKSRLSRPWTRAILRGHIRGRTRGATTPTGTRFRKLLSHRWAAASNFGIWQFLLKQAEIYRTKSLSKCPTNKRKREPNLGQPTETAPPTTSRLWSHDLPHPSQETFLPSKKFLKKLTFTALRRASKTKYSYRCPNSHRKQGSKSKSNKNNIKNNKNKNLLSTPTNLQIIWAKKVSLS